MSKDSPKRIVIDFDPTTLPPVMGVRTILINLLKRTNKFERDIAYDSSKDEMRLILTLREKLTTDERKAVISDVKRAIELIGSLSELSTLR